MGSIFSFKCETCGKVHEGAPSFSFRAPDPFLEQPEEVKEAGELNSDLCWYEDQDGVHYFVRVCLEIPIRGFGDPFLWGVWVSLSKSSFDRYVETYDDPNESDCYFGWLCNYIPYYEDTYALKTDVRPRANGVRPSIIIEKNDHPLSIDFHEGLTIEKAQQIAEHVMHR